MLNSSQLHRHINALKSGDEPTRRETLRSLKEYDRQAWADAPAEAVRPLVESLQRQLTAKGHGAELKNLPRYRQEVATILGRIGPSSEAAIPDLVALLAAGTADGVREAAATALGNIGRPARGAVSDLLAVLTPECRVSLAACVARALGEIGCADQRVRAALLSLWSLSIRDEHSRAQVAMALCKLKIEAPGLIDSLTETLVGHGKAGARLPAAEALSWCSKDAVGVVPALMAALTDEDEPTKEAAKRGLARMAVSPAKGVQICCEQLDECPLALTALRKSGAIAITPLIETLRSKNADTRQKAAQTLGAIKEIAAPAVPALTTALKDKDASVRLAAAKALWNIAKQPDGVVPTLIDFLRGHGLPPADAGELRRTFLQTVIEALSRIGPVAKAAGPALRATLKDENRLVRESATRALKAIDGL
jgi:HEAT repeat protein